MDFKWLIFRWLSQYSLYFFVHLILFAAAVTASHSSTSVPAPPLSTRSNVFFPLINSFSEFTMHSHTNTLCQTFSWILFVFAHTIPPLEHFVCICETMNELIMQQVKCTETFCCCYFYNFTLQLCDSQPASQPVSTLRFNRTIVELL